MLQERGQTSTTSCNIQNVARKNWTIFKLGPTTRNMLHVVTGWPNKCNMLCPTMLRYVPCRWNVASVWPGLKEIFNPPRGSEKLQTGLCCSCWLNPGSVKNKMFWLNSVFRTSRISLLLRFCDNRVQKLLYHPITEFTFDVAIINRLLTPTDHSGTERTAIFYRSGAEYYLQQNHGANSDDDKLWNFVSIQTCSKHAENPTQFYFLLGFPRFAFGLRWITAHLQLRYNQTSV